MIRVLYFAQEPCQSVSFWRGMGLFAELERTHPGEFDVVQVGDREVNWWDIARADVVWFTRPTSAQFEPIFRMAESHGAPIIVDWDDLFLDIPFGNPVRNRISGECKRLSAMYVNRATIATVSTPQLAASFKKHGLSVPLRVLPNALHDRYRWRQQGPPTKTVLWRGAAGHDADIDEVGDDIVALAEEFADWRWVFAGWDPWRITKRLKPGTWATFEPQPIAHYHQTIVGLCPSIIMSPLCDNEFNRCKSRIGVFEAAMAGGTFVCPDFPVFQFGSTRYSHQVVERSFHAAMSDELSMDPLGHRTGALAARLLIDERERTRHTLPILKSILESAVSA